MRTKVTMIIGLVSIAIVLFLLLSVNGENDKTNEVQNIKELVNDYSVGNIRDQSASITSQQLIVTNSDESQLVYGLPEEEFFVSIAPYIEQTHPCAVHSLTGCRGELADKEFEVYIEDRNGNVVMNEKMTSQPNGFIDLWLPRDETYHITVAYDGKTSQLEFSTYDNDDTCITTMQLTEKSA